MDLSIIIVNYNVKFYLEQCLFSVLRASKNINAEIIVVDNNSVDDSAKMVSNKFPSVILIRNNTNVGFSKANNKALAVAKGKYCLLLNPDTIVEESSFEKCISFMDSNPEAGLIGVKMINGKGKFLPESKRSLPTPVVAFYKIFGLSAIFPRSPKFGKYHLHYLNPDVLSEVDVISGAFMFIRKKALEKTGFLDEKYFMYGEDIDLSYKVKKAGYKNYYFPDTVIIHYKGASTKKENLNYIILFYKAMIIFYNNHFAKNSYRLCNLLIYLAICVRAGISILKRLFDLVYQALIDGLLIYSGYIISLLAFEKYHFELNTYFQQDFVHIYLFAYTVISLFSIYIKGGYKKPVKLKNIIKAYLLGSFILLIINSLLPENFKFNYLVLISGIMTGFIFILFSRLLFAFSGFKDYKLSTRKRAIIVGPADEAKNVAGMLQSLDKEKQIIGYVSGSASQDTSMTYLGANFQLKEIIKIKDINEVIFCTKNTTLGEIIRQMHLLSTLKAEFKISFSENILKNIHCDILKN